MMRNLLLVVGAAVALTGSAYANAASSSWTRVRAAAVTGDFAHLTATAPINTPHAVAFQVAANPSQLVTAHWSLVCQAGIHAKTRIGQWIGVAPTRLARSPHRRMVFPMAAPDTCLVAVVAQLSRSHSRLVLALARR